MVRMQALAFQADVLKGARPAPASYLSLSEHGLNTRLNRSLLRNVRPTPNVTAILKRSCATCQTLSNKVTVGEAADAVRDPKSLDHLRRPDDGRRKFDEPERKVWAMQVGRLSTSVNNHFDAQFLCFR